MKMLGSVGVFMVDEYLDELEILSLVRPYGSEDACPIK